MTAQDQAYAEIERRVAAWAAAEADVRGALVIGSRARRDHPADQWSDLDVLLFARDPDRLRDDEAWVSAFGDVVLTFVERAGDGRSWERRVLYAGGLDVDFALNPVGVLDYLLENPLPAGMADLLRRGIRTLIDKDGLLARVAALPLPVQPLASTPSETEFLTVVRDYWYHTLWTAKHLRRGELWWAKSGLDGRCNGLLFQMLIWQALAEHGPSHDTWLRGRFLEEWADPHAVAQLGGVFARYEAADVARALPDSMRVFRGLATDTARRLGYPYPLDADRHVTALVRETLAPWQ